MNDISKTADKALAILTELAAAGPLSPQQLALRIDVNRTVVQRLLVTLLHREFVTRADGEYTLAPRVRRLAAATYTRLRGVVTPLDEALTARTGETTIFQILDGDMAVVLDEAYASSQVSLQARHEVGSRSPATSSASGLAILAALDDHVVTRILRGSEHDTETTLARLREVRTHGFALSSNELQADVSGMAIAVHCDGSVAGSVAMLVPLARADELERYRHDLERTAARMERALR